MSLLIGIKLIKSHNNTLFCCVYNYFYKEKCYEQSHQLMYVRSKRLKEHHAQQGLSTSTWLIIVGLGLAERVELVALREWDFMNGKGGRGDWTSNHRVLT